MVRIWMGGGAQGGEGSIWGSMWEWMGARGVEEGERGGRGRAGEGRMGGRGGGGEEGGGMGGWGEGLGGGREGGSEGGGRGWHTHTCKRRYIIIHMFLILA